MLDTLDGVLNLIADRIALRMKADQAGSVSQRLFNVDQAATYLNRTANSVHHLIATGKLPSVRLDGRAFLDIRDLDGAIEEDRQGQPDCPAFRVFVEGKSRDLPPMVRDEVYRVACECLRNAFRHAQAKRIEVQVRYDQRHFWLQIVDDGKGIDPAVLSAGGRAGHHGLPGLHERAQLAGGKLSVWSQVNSGTQIELTIPGAIAYPKSKTMSAGKETG